MILHHQMSLFSGIFSRATIGGRVDNFLTMAHIFIFILSSAALTVNDWPSKIGVCASLHVAPAWPVIQREEESHREVEQWDSYTRDSKIPRGGSFPTGKVVTLSSHGIKIATYCFFPDRVKWDLWNVSTTSSYLVRLQSAPCREVTRYRLATVWKWKRLAALRWQFYFWKTFTVVMFHV